MKLNYTHAILLNYGEGVAASFIGFIIGKHLQLDSCLGFIFYLRL